MVSDKTFGRLILYRHILGNLAAEGTRYVFSHELAALAGSTAAQVRRDLMAATVSGSPTKGYDIKALQEALGRLIDTPSGERAALVGIGNLGRAILSHSEGRNPKLSIVAAFDWDPIKVNRVLHGCICYPMGELTAVVKKSGIQVGIVAVPADEAQRVTDMLVAAGIKGLLNFAPVRLKVPPTVYLEDIDFGMSLEKVAYYARGKGTAGRDAEGRR